MASTETWVELFINSSFRDSADEDYLAARIAYRYGLTHTFLWSALQAVEKYLKAILLYNGHSTDDIVHDVLKAFDRLPTIQGIPFSFPPDIRLFVEYINEEGPNRYFEFPVVLREDALLELDRTAWHLRRYCYNIRRVGSGDGLAKEIAKLQRDPLEYRHKFRHEGGYLEKTLAKQSDLRRHLVWKNFWFGTVRRRTIKAFPLRWQTARPVHFMRPEVYHALKGLVHFSKPVREYLDGTPGSCSERS